MHCILLISGGGGWRVRFRLSSRSLSGPLQESHTHELNRDVRTVRSAREAVRWRSADLTLFEQRLAAGLPLSADAAPEGGWLAAWAAMQEVGLSWTQGSADPTAKSLGFRSAQTTQQSGRLTSATVL